MLLAIVYLTMGIMFVIMSLVTWKFNRLGIIAGYGEKKILNKKGLAAWFRKCTLGLAACALWCCQWYVFICGHSMIIQLSFLDCRLQ